jgi:hypothetical protein
MSDFIQNAVNNLYRDNELAALKAENARLKAEVERLTAGGYHRNFDFSVEHLTRLFNDGRIAEVSYEGERSQWYCADAYARCVNAEIEAKRLKAEVERLTKVALKVYQELDEFGQVSAKSVHELRDAAKGGKQP